MCRLKQLGQWVGLLGLVGWLENPAVAEETTRVAATNQPTWRTVIRSENLVDATNARPIERALFNAGTNRFAFVIPADFKLDASNPGKFVLTSADYSCFITLQLVGAGTSASAGLMINSFRNQAQDEFPLGTISSEFELRAANHGGPAYELRWVNSNGTDQLAYVGFIPSQAGLLKFTLLSEAQKAHVNQNHFRSLLRSFQNNESGKLEIQTVSGAS
jgi:hypothetical protein